MYSFGVLLCEMFIKQDPDPDQRLVQVMQIRESRFQNLVERCTLDDPWMRPDMETIIEQLEPLQIRSWGWRWSWCKEMACRGCSLMWPAAIGLLKQKKDFAQKWSSIPKRILFAADMAAGFPIHHGRGDVKWAHSTMSIIKSFRLCVMQVRISQLTKSDLL